MKCVDGREMMIVIDGRDKNGRKAKADASFSVS